MSAVENKLLWSTIVTRGIIFSVIWWVLSGNDVRSWSIGVPAVLLATITSNFLTPPTTLVWHRLLRFIPFFLWHSLLGGVDVAWRALWPSRSIAPGLIEYPLHLPPGFPRIFMANVVTMLPGTLSADLDGNILLVHVLNQRRRVLVDLGAVEKNIAAMFDISLQLSNEVNENEKV